MPARRPVPGQIARPLPFWLGIVLITVGVCLHIVDFVEMRAMLVAGPTMEMPGMAMDMPGMSMPGMSMPSLSAPPRTMAEMGMGPLGTWGMAIDVFGLVLAAWGLLPRGWLAEVRGRPPQAPPAGEAMATAPMAAAVDVGALDTTRMTGAHWFIMLRLFLGLVLDTMKPATIGFMLPGLKEEYGISAAQASLLPLFALTGTTVGSIVFGYLGDVIGRRASFILTALILAATAICGVMPAFPWQLLMCFIMGMAAGGELPLVYSMLAETMPARHRGWLSVVVGGIGGLGGLLAASLVAGWLEPALSWRALFLPNLPTALIMLLLIWRVPETPRFLMARGFHAEARQAMARVGVRVDAGAGGPEHGPVLERRRMREAFQGALRVPTIALCTYGAAWGLCNWGFITWLPTMLRDLQVDPASVSHLLGTSALFAIPGILAAAALFALWSSRCTAVLFAIATGAVLLFLAAAGGTVASQPFVLSLALVALLVASSSMIGVLAPYSVEVYPTALRSAGSGIVSASSKVTGLVAPTLVGVLLGIAPGVVLPALAIGVPLTGAGLLMLRAAPETRGRTLEELTGDVVPVMH